MSATIEFYLIVNCDTGDTLKCQSNKNSETYKTGGRFAGEGRRIGRINIQQSIIGRLRISGDLKT